MWKIDESFQAYANYFERQFRFYFKIWFIHPLDGL